ncbi:MAG: hypothetical protein NT080_09780 [Spirochaetes bacterium]|nr:hypothetical protein [Spirochaetota bacterium]
MKTAPVYFAVNVLLASIACVALSLAYPESGIGEPETIGAAVAVYAAAAFVTARLGRSLHGYLPPRFESEGAAARRAFDPRHLACNFHAPLVVTIAGLFAFMNFMVSPTMETYPIVRGNILIVAKTNHKMADGRSYWFADQAASDLLLHAVIGMKESVTDIASKTAGKFIKEKKASELKDVFASLGRLSLRDAFSKLVSRVRFSGKPPILLYGIRFVNYTGFPLSASQVRSGVSFDEYRLPPYIGRTVTLREGLEEDDTKLLELPRDWSRFGSKPDSFNFVRSFYALGGYREVFSKDSQDWERLQAGFAEPATRPVLIWFSDDCYEPDRLDGYPFYPSFTNPGDPILSNQAALEYTIFRRFFGQRLFIGMNGLQQYENAEVRGKTIKSNLGIERFFDSSQRLELPPIRFADPVAGRKDLQKAIDELHRGLEPFIESLLAEGLQIDIATLTPDRDKEREGLIFRYDEIAALIMAPFAIWTVGIALRTLAYRKVEG